MTKFILHGGASSNKSDDNRKFFAEIINSVNSSNINILCIYFARPEHRWSESFEEDKEMFLAVNSEKELHFDLAKIDADDFVNQIKNTDILFINGGRKGCLKEVLEKMDNFSDLIQNKVVVGISAGANILSKYYYSSVADGIREGIGLLPIKTFCHFTDNDISELDTLDRHKEKLTIYKISEEKFVIIEIQ